MSLRSSILAMFACACVASNAGFGSVEGLRPAAAFTDEGLLPPLWSAPPPPLTGEVAVAQYEVAASNVSSAFELMHATARIAMPGSTGDARTSYNIATRWTASVGLDGGRGVAPTTCALRMPTVTMTQRVTIPFWSFPSTVDATSIHQWIRMRAALDRHEAAHLALGRSAALEILDSLVALRAPCAELSARAGAVRARIMGELRRDNARFDTITRHGRDLGTEVERRNVPECRISRGDAARSRDVVAFGLRLAIPRELTDSASDEADPHWIRWSGADGSSLTLDFRLGAEPHKRFGMAQNSACAARIGGHAVEVVRGRATDGTHIFAARWLGVGGPQSEPSGNTFMIVGRAATDDERDRLLSYSILVRPR